MTQEIDNNTENSAENNAENIINEVDKMFAFSGIAISGLALLFYVGEEIADSSETDLEFLGTIAKVVSGLGLIGTLWSAGLLYTREVQIPPLLKWVLIPLLVLDVILVSLLIGMLVLDTASVSKVGNAVLKYVKPAICSLGAIGLIIAMAVVPEKLLKMSLIGMTIHYLPAAFAYANKNPYYAIVIIVRAGGLTTALAGNFIDVTAEVEEEDNPDEQKQLES